MVVCVCVEKVGYVCMCVSGEWECPCMWVLGFFDCVSLQYGTKLCFVPL